MGEAESRIAMPPHVAEQTIDGDLAALKKDRKFSAAEVAQHCTKGDVWIVIDGVVYDVSNWIPRHPGGPALIKQWAGQDATSAFAAFHPEASVRPRKQLGSMKIGEVDAAYERPGAACENDLATLREEAKAEGLFQPHLSFYAAHLAHIIVLEAAAWYLLWNYGPAYGRVFTYQSAAVFLLASAIFVTAQAQAGWLQHDLGHLSVFRDPSTNHIAHKFVICFLKAASASWWNWRHFQHHSKPNIIRMDPDIKMAYFFVIGDVIPRQWGTKKKGLPLYHWQHHYWYLVGPPFLLPVYFHIDVVGILSEKKIGLMGYGWQASSHVGFSLARLSLASSVPSSSTSGFVCLRATGSCG